MQDMKRFKGSNVKRVVLEIPEIDEDTNETIYKEFYCDLTSLTVGAMDVLMPVMGRFLADIQKASKGGEIPEGAEDTLIDTVLKSLSESPKMLVDILVEVATVKEIESGEEIEAVELRDWFTKNINPPALQSLVDISISLTDLGMYAANFMQTQTQLTQALIPIRPEKSKGKTTPHPAQQRKRSGG
jgi:hypothetical protein